MKKIFFFLSIMFLLSSCKKDKVDATSRMTFQSSINDMASSLTTLQQVKFNEALYILKTFGVKGETDVEEIDNLGKLLNGKKVPEILAMADDVAQKNGIAWSSTAPPSLGEMNIFGDGKVSEFDANDIKASSLTINVKPVSADSVLGPKALQIIPRLVDSQGNPISFAGAALETTMEVSNNGSHILTSRNLMQDNDFKGFNLRMSAIPMSKVPDGKVDITVTVKTSKKTFKMTKTGVAINTKALLMPQATPDEKLPETPVANPDVTPTETPAAPAPAVPDATGSPKAAVSDFLNNLSSQNFRGAYSKSENPAWGSYENFSNPTSGFGGVKNINVKNISEKSGSPTATSVTATYDVTDKDGRVTSLNVTFGLKNVNGTWKISSYKIN